MVTDFKPLFKKKKMVQVPFSFFSVWGYSTFTSRFRGKSTEGDCLEDKRLFPPSLPGSGHTVTLFHVCKLVLSPQYNFSSSNRIHLVMHKQISSWLIFTHRESGQASSYSSAPLPPLQDPPGSGPPAFLHIWAVSSWRLPSILGGLIFGTI